MGFSENPMEGMLVESEVKKWVIAGSSLRSPLKPIFTNYAAEKETDKLHEDQEASTTPKSEESRIPSRLACPPAPRKRKTSSRCQYSGVREFFNPPAELETVFRLRVERA